MRSLFYVVLPLFDWNWKLILLFVDFHTIFSLIVVSYLVILAVNQSTIYFFYPLSLNYIYKPLQFKLPIPPLYSAVMLFEFICFILSWNEKHGLLSVSSKSHFIQKFYPAKIDNFE
jgi:hypothetical protein